MLVCVRERIGVCAAVCPHGCKPCLGDQTWVHSTHTLPWSATLRPVTLAADRHARSGCARERKGWGGVGVVVETDKSEMCTHDEGAPRHTHVHADVRHHGTMKGNGDQRVVGAVQRAPAHGSGTYPCVSAACPHPLANLDGHTRTDFRQPRAEQDGSNNEKSAIGERSESAKRKGRGGAWHAGRKQRASRYRCHRPRRRGWRQALSDVT